LGRGHGGYIGRAETALPYNGFEESRLYFKSMAKIESGAHTRFYI
jgi:hypothetical protein